MDVLPTTEPTDTITVATSPTTALPCDSPIADSPPDSTHMHPITAPAAPITSKTKPTNNRKSLLRTISALENSPKDLRQDFRDMGFPAKRVREIMNIRESRRPDGHLPRTESSDSNATRGASEGRGGRVVKGKGGKGVVEGEEYVPLRLGENENWVLFDPLLSYPAFQSANDNTSSIKRHEPSAHFGKYDRFVPGNTRVLEFNLETKSVRLRSTPEILLEEGMEVEYTERGPKLVRTIIQEVRAKKANGVGKGSKAKPRKEKAVKKSKEVIEDSGPSDWDELVS